MDMSYLVLAGFVVCTLALVGFEYLSARSERSSEKSPAGHALGWGLAYFSTGLMEYVALVG